MNIISHLFTPLTLLNPLRYIATSSYNINNNFIKKPEKNNKNNIIKNMELLLLNMDGVLRIGENPIAIAKESFNYYRKYNNTQICILTNECRKTSKTIKKELINMGYNMGNVKLITASTIILNYIEDLIKNSSKLDDEEIHFSLIVEESIYFYIKDNLNNKYKNINFHWLFDKNPNKITLNIDYFIIGCINNDNISKISIIRNKLISQVKLNKNAKFILTCPDKVDVENKTSIHTFLPTYILSLINKQLYLNIDYYCPSKPETKYIKKQIKSLYNINVDEEISQNDNIMIIGDDIDTDIKIGEDLKIQKGLVLTGVTSSNDLKYKNTNTLQNINYIVPDLSYFLY